MERYQNNTDLSVRLSHFYKITDILSGLHSLQHKQINSAGIKFRSSVSGTNLYSIRKTFELSLNHVAKRMKFVLLANFSQSFTFVMTDSDHEFLHFPVKVLLN